MSLDSTTIRYVTDLVYRRSAIVVEAGKDYLIEARLGPIARAQGLASIDALTQKLRQTHEGPLHTEVVEAMTTNETSFFRDVHPFEMLKKDIIPSLINSRASTRSLKIWCAASSTGQEPYTIAMVLRENFPVLQTWNVQILATDLNTQVLDRARSGIFKQLEVNRGLPAPMLVKYFDRVGADWQIKADLRKMISFQQLNLLERWPVFGQQDVVFMRNILIYFDVETKRGILERVRQNLRPDGCLILGGAETTMNVDDGFEPTRTSGSVLYRLRSNTPARVASNATR